MIPKNKRFSLALVLLMCLTLCLTALSEGDTEEVSITIFDENGKRLDYAVEEYPLKWPDEE